MSVSGGCLCGAVRFTVDATPLGVRTCWCRLCQYLAAGNATVNVIFPADKLTVTGEVRWHEAVADSGNHMRRGFCPECGTPLFSDALVRPHLAVIRAGALDDPNLVAPQSTIWTSAAPDWAHIDPDLPQHEQQAPPVA
ncbi:aldehyde-activating protein [Sphingomonas sp. DBB INV C78]|uniref:GFA family protein n=1 Tax=Sphingomonas sp. DBB INV C78 TaxID=3349434 RepID=UPI0036D36637